MGTLQRETEDKTQNMQKENEDNTLHDLLQETEEKKQHVTVPYYWEHLRKCGLFEIGYLKTRR